MSVGVWRWIVWLYHLLFAVAVVWPGQALVNAPRPFILGLPRQIVWIEVWVIGSLIVLWRLDVAENRAGRQRRSGGGVGDG